jgi:hypothetical protein
LEESHEKSEISDQNFAALFRPPPQRLFLRKIKEYSWENPVNGWILKGSAAH